MLEEEEEREVNKKVPSGRLDKQFSENPVCKETKEKQETTNKDSNFWYLRPLSSVTIQVSKGLQL